VAGQGLVADIIVQLVWMEHHIKRDLHARCDVPLHWSNGEVRGKPILFPVETGSDLSFVDHENPPSALAVLYHSSEWHMITVQIDLQSMT